MLAVRRVLANTIFACVGTIIVLMRVTIVQLALWLLPNAEAQEIRNDLKRNGY